MKGKAVLKKIVAFLTALTFGAQGLFAYAEDYSIGEINSSTYIYEVMDFAPNSEQEIKNKIQAIANDATYGVGKYWGDQDCFLYARTVFEMIFGIKAPTAYYYNSQQLTGSNANNINLIASYADDGNHNAYSVLVQAKPGDIIQAKLWYGGISHTMIVWEVSASDRYITVLDCNSKGNNEICKRTISFDNFVRGSKVYSGTTGQYEYSGYGNTFTINRSINYPASVPPVNIDPAVLSVKAGTNKTNTDFSWTSTETDVNFDVVIYKDKLWEGDPALRTNVGSNHSFSCLLAPGKYCAYIDTIRNDTGVLLMSNVVEFTVTVPKYDYTIENINQAETALYLIYNQNENTVRAGRTKRQMIEYLLTSSDYAVFGGANWPVGINDYTDTITDNSLAAIDGTTTIKLDSSARAQMSFGWFASGVVYTQDISLASARCSKIMDNPGAGNYTVDYVRNHFKQKLQAGEHIRIDELCSLTFVSCDDNGFYWLEYGSDDGSDAHIRMRYASFDTFVSWLNSTGRAMWHYYVDLTDNTPHSIGNAKISAIANQRYSGNKITPEVTVTYNGRTLKKDVDYTVSYANNINAGTASVTVTGIGAFTDSKSSNFTIDRLSIYYAQFQRFLTKKIYYNGSPCTVPIILVYNGTTLIEGKDYTVKFTNNVNVGTAGIYIDGIGNFCDTRTQAFPILSKDINQCTVNADLSDKTYNFKPITPTVTVFDPERNCNLVNGTDFDIKYTDNIDPGTATVTVTGKGNYTGTCELHFIIKAPAVTKPAIVGYKAGEGKVKLQWKEVPGAEMYRVYYYLGGKYTRVFTTDGSRTIATVSGLTGGTKYGFVVSAKVNGAWTAYNDPADLVYVTPTGTPKPTIVGYKVGENKVKLQWNEVPGAEMYRVYYHLGGKYTRVFTTDGSRTIATVSGLSGGTEYGFVVSAKVNGAWTAYNDAADLVYATPTGTAKPFIIGCKPGDGKVKLEWQAVPKAEMYRVYYYLNGKYTRAFTTDGSRTIATVSGLTNGTNYAFIVSAKANGTWTDYTNSSEFVLATPNA